MILTPQVIQNAPTFVNPEGRFTLSLRNLQLPHIDTLHLAQGPYQVLDLTNNELVEFGGIPDWETLETVILANNNITTISNLHIPSLKLLSLAQNSISSLRSLEPLHKLENLLNLLLIGNPVCAEHHYRPFLVWLIPLLQILDGKKVKSSERECAKELFGENLENATAAAIALLHGGKEPEPVAKDTKMLNLTVKKLTAEEKAGLVAQLEKATTMEEILRIQDALKNGLV